MNQAEEHLRDKIISQVKELDQDKLIFLEDILKRLETKADSRKEILTFAGIWHDMDRETITRLTTGLHKMREGKHGIAK